MSEPSAWAMEMAVTLARRWPDGHVPAVQHRRIAEALDSAREDGRREERAAVVAYLRGLADAVGGPYDNTTGAAEAIEGGEHVFWEAALPVGTPSPTPEPEAPAPSPSSRRTGVTSAILDVITAHCGGGLGSAEIAAETGLPLRVVSTLLCRLFAQGLVERGAHPSRYGIRYTYTYVDSEETPCPLPR